MIIKKRVAKLNWNSMPQGNCTVAWLDLITFSPRLDRKPIERLFNILYGIPIFLFHLKSSLEAKIILKIGSKMEYIWTYILIIWRHIKWN